MIQLNKNRIMIAGLIIITVFAIGCLSESETEFQISKAEVDVNAVVNITPEELSGYPALERALKGEVCVGNGGYYRQITRSQTPIGATSLCKVTNDDWKKIKDFIDGKRIYDPGRGTCYKFGELYGDTCYTFGFVKP